MNVKHMKTVVIDWELQRFVITNTVVITTYIVICVYMWEEICINWDAKNNINSFYEYFHIAHVMTD